MFLPEFVPEPFVEWRCKNSIKDNRGRTARQYMLELEELDEHKDIVKLLQLGSRLFILL